MITPLSALNEALGNTLEPGHFILAHGLQGGGKTILGGQLLTICAIHKLKALFISTEVQPIELERRMQSAHAGVRYSDTEKGDGFVLTESGLMVLDGKLFGSAIQEKSTLLAGELQNHCRVVKPQGFGINPESTIRSLVARFEQSMDGQPDVVIFDYIKDMPDMPLDSYVIRNSVMSIGSALQALAKKREMCVWAFIQARVSAVTSKLMERDKISEYPKLATLADAVIGISHREREIASDTEWERPCRIYNRVQHLTVEVTNKPKVVVPVVCEFEYQRFAPYVPGQGGQQPNISQTECERIASEIVRTNEYHGYVLCRREAVKTILKEFGPNALNLFAFLLMTSDKSGTSYWSRDKISKKLGLSLKQVRTEGEHLEDIEFVQLSTGVTHRNLLYQINYWKEDQDPSIPGYFKLFRNLRDESRQDLLSNPRLFQLWIYLLCSAKNYADEGTDFQPGQSLLTPARTTEELKITRDELFVGLEGLKKRGSIFFDATQDRPLISIVNWELYNRYVYPSKNPQSYQYTNGQMEGNTQNNQYSSGQEEGQ